MAEQESLFAEKPCPRAARLIDYCRSRQIPEVLPDTIEAGDSWGANCGPMSLAAVLGLTTVAAARPLVEPFRGFMSPTDMLVALHRAGVQSKVGGAPIWPDFGLVRIQWVGSWCDPSVDRRAAYRYTHWIGARKIRGPRRKLVIEVYDATPNRWIPLKEWEEWSPVLWPSRATGWRLATDIEVRP